MHRIGIGKIVRFVWLDSVVIIVWDCPCIYWMGIQLIINRLAKCSVMNQKTDIRIIINPLQYFTQSNPMIMVKKQSGYYYSVDEKSSPQTKQPQQSKTDNKVPLEVIGNVKGYIQHVAGEVARIKKLKAEQKQAEMKNKLILDQLSVSGQSACSPCPSPVQVNITIPAQLLLLSNRIEALQQKLSSNELIRQKLQRKGPLSERTKALLANLQKLSEKSADILSGSINSFVKNLQQRQQNQKILSLYDTFTKTNVLGEQIDMLDQYLSNLAEIMRKFKALPQIQGIVGQHETLLKLRQKNRDRVRRIEKWMQEQYAKIVQEIDSI